jgi:hypothetical protein
MLRYFLATNDQVLGSLSDRMSLFSGGLIELKCAIRGSLGSLGPREIKKKKDAFVCFQF